MGRKRKEHTGKNFQRQVKLPGSSSESHFTEIDWGWTLGSTKRALIWPETTVRVSDQNN